MTDYGFVGKCAFWSGAVGVLFVLIVVGAITGASTASVLAALGLIPVGGIVVGALLALSLTEHEEE